MQGKLGAWISLSLPFSLNFSEPSYPYFIYDIQGFKLYLEGRTEKITYTPIFSEIGNPEGFLFEFIVESKCGTTGLDNDEADSSFEIQCSIFWSWI